jgi:hypothetical protein
MDNEQFLYALAGICLLLPNIFYTAVSLVRLAIIIFNPRLIMAGLCFLVAFPQLRFAIYNLVDDLITTYHVVQYTLTWSNKAYRCANYFIAVGNYTMSAVRSLFLARRFITTPPPNITPPSAIPAIEENYDDFDTIVVLPRPDNLDGPQSFFPSTDMLIDSVRPEDLDPPRDNNNNSKQKDLPVPPAVSSIRPTHLVKLALYTHFSEQYKIKSWNKIVPILRRLYPEYIW